MKEKYTNLFLITIAISLFVVFPSWATYEDAGYPWAFLTRVMGARAIGLGEAGVAVSDDATATYWNPAGLGLIKEPQAVFMSIKSDPSETASLSEPTSLVGGHNYLSFVLPPSITRIGSIGCSLNHLSLGDIQHTTGTSELDFKRYGYFKDTEYALTFSYGRTLLHLTDPETALLFWGVSIRYMRQKFFDVSTTTPGIDTGFILKRGNLWRFSNIKLGWVIHGSMPRKWKATDSDVEVIDETDSDPKVMDWTWGLSSDVQLIPKYDIKLTPALSLDNRLGASPPTLSLGGEVRISRFLVIRAGIEDAFWLTKKVRFIKWNSLKSIYNGRKFRIGGGVSISHIQLDYATAFEHLGTKHRISMTVRY